MRTKKDAGRILKFLDQGYPDAECSLDHNSPLQLLAATILSAQCTDVQVNRVTEEMFKKYKTAADYAQASLTELEDDVRSTGFFRNKAKSLKGLGQALVDQHQGRVPDRLDDLVKLPGVGRKTANVVLGNAFGVPGMVVDTHVTRFAGRMGLSDKKDAVKIEFDLMEQIPKKRWVKFSHQVIAHGRKVCKARKPDCQSCSMPAICIYFKNLND